MGQKFFTILLALAISSPLRAAVPGLSLSLGPYLGFYKPSLKTFNNQILLYVPRPALGSAAEYGIQVKSGLPLIGIGAGLNFGRWSNKDKWTALAGRDDIYTDTREYKITLYPLEAFADYSLPIIPMVLKGRVGGLLGISWCTFEDDRLRVLNSTGAEEWHSYVTAKGNTLYLGLNAGLDLVSIPKLTIGCDLGYRIGKIEQLTIKKSNDPTDINTLYEYRNPVTGQHIPLPLELNGLFAKLVARYHF